MRFAFFLLVCLSLPAVAQRFGVEQPIQSTSPQLVSFAGSDANLRALSNGLANGQTVTLVTQGSDGVLQIVTFTPPAALGNDTARALEQARTALISRGIVQPSAQQIATVLMGGTLVTNAGPLQVAGLLTGTIAANAVQVRTEVAANPAATAFGGSAANLQALTDGLRTGRPITLTGTSANGTAQSLTFTVPGGPMSASEASQALQLASQLLASQGILSPTIDQIRAALLGGTLTLAGGNAVAVQGVLQGRVRSTSESTIIGTSNSPTIGTSNSPTVPGPIIGSPPSISSGAGATTPAPMVGSSPGSTPRFGSVPR